ncbi:MAG: Gfo/Idh/MocA family oxidoreductase [Planctomycetota bacterium]|nr:Gfo/Idh/MocA family oxidoreductase [Planctomycetota bacterium]
MVREMHVALIGQKFMGRAHSNAYSQVCKHFDLPLVPVMDTIAARDGGELEPFAEQWGWQRWTDRWQDLAQNEDIELVDVATPNDVHLDQTVAMLEAGKHVACEKPLAGTLADARQMRDAAKKAKGKTFVWFNYRRCPAVGLARQLVLEGRIGRVYHVRAHYLQSWGGPETPLVWRFQKRRAGSGAHGDLNAHIVDLARFITGEEITEVHGATSRTFIKKRKVPGSTREGRSDVDDAVGFLAAMSGGGMASFEASRLAHGHQNRNVVEVNGEKGSVRWDFEDMNVLEFCDAQDGDREGGWRRIMCTSAGNHPYVEAWWPDAHVLGYEHGFVNMAADMFRSLARRKTELPLPDFEDAYQTQRVLEAATLAAKNRCSIKLSEVR